MYYNKVVKHLFILNLISLTLRLGQNNTSNLIEINFESNGDRIHGWFYKAERKGLVPSVILIQGFPGRDGDLFEIGQNLIKEGFNALTFNYSGTWRSEGIWTPETSLRNVGSAIDFLKSEQSIKTYQVDTSQISLIGYSYGGGMALLGSLHDRSVKRIISIAGGDLSVVAKMIEESLDFRQSHQQFLEQIMSDSAVCRGLGGKLSHEWLLRNKDDYDLNKHIEELAEKDILLIGGWQDRSIMVEDHILPFYRSLQKHGTVNLEIVIFNADHSFNNVRYELTSKIISWLKM